MYQIALLNTNGTQQSAEFVCLPGCQGLQALRQGAGRRSFTELVLWSGQRPEDAHCKSTNITIKCKPANRCQTKHGPMTKSKESVLLSGVA